MRSPVRQTSPIARGHLEEETTAGQCRERRRFPDGRELLREGAAVAHGAHALTALAHFMNRSFEILICRGQILGEARRLLDKDR